MFGAADPSSSGDAGPGNGQPPGTPGWVKAFALALALLVVALVVATLTGGHTPPAGVH